MVSFGRFNKHSSYLLLWYKSSFFTPHVVSLLNHHGFPIVSLHFHPFSYGFFGPTRYRRSPSLGVKATELGQPPARHSGRGNRAAVETTVRVAVAAEGGMEVLKEAEKDLAGPNKKYDMYVYLYLYLYIYI